MKNIKYKVFPNTIQYEFWVYVHKKDTDYSNTDKVYSRVYGTQYQAARYVADLNESDRLGLHYYFINKGIYNGRY